MHFVDECQMIVEAGKGGDGAIAFRREKFIPLGGPAGGDGGHGGSIIFVGAEGKGTLSDLTHQRTLRADPGANGQGMDCYGRGGKDLRVGVPLGTIVRDLGTEQLLGEITADGQELVVAKGGRGGKGNKHYVTPVDRAPRRAQQGTPGESRRLKLELKVMADVGLLGFPNVGKSTFISAVSRARPTIADYPFTTLEPHLGVVHIGDTAAGLGHTFVIADIPGLIPGASEGHGLGSRFLRHVERTRLLLHLVTITDDPERDPVADYQALRKELAQFDTALAERPEVVALSKADLPDVREAFPELQQRFRDEAGVKLHLVSAADRTGVRDLLNLLSRSSAPGSDE
ncbi:MAG: GTPase CgtA [Pseudomonadota bacterium]|jgi:GTP-binding protein